MEILGSDAPAVMEKVSCLQFSALSVGFSWLGFTDKKLEAGLAILLIPTMWPWR